MRISRTHAAIAFLAGILSCALAQEINFYDDDALFGAGVESQGDDDFFSDDNIEEMEERALSQTSTDLAHGILFQNGSIKIGGTFDTSLETYTVLYDGADEDKSLGDNISETRISPTADAQLYIDARPTQTLRMYTKAGVRYPYTVTASSYPVLGEYEITGYPPSLKLPVTTGVVTTIQNSFYVKELFTDFSIADRAFFRFGLHTVTWGAGYFFSPVSDILNTSSINPEDTDEQVNGSLNLRTQITFSGTQDCLWLYVIPDSITNSSQGTIQDYLRSAQYPYDARKTALALKGDIVLGGWELGIGAFYKWQSAPRAMLTATGSIINGKVSVFAEGVYRYGSNAEWESSPEAWDDKTHIAQLTLGASYWWKNPLITFAAQYYYDGDADDHEYYTKGHNIAGTVNFGRIKTTSLTANIFALFNIGKSALPESLQDLAALAQSGSVLNPYAGIISGMINYSPINNLTLSMGPYLTWLSWEEKPTVALKLKATLGGGKF